MLRETSLRVLESITPKLSIVIDGNHCKDGDGATVYVETWGENNFIADGADVVRDSLERPQTRILLVWKNGDSGNTLAMIIDSIAASKREDQNNVVEISLDNGEDFDVAIEAASRRKGISIIIVTDGAEPQFDVEKLADSASDIDRRGF